MTRRFVPGVARTPPLDRRGFLGGVVVAVAVGLAGCGGGRDGPTTARDPARVTTTVGDAVVVLVAQMVIRDGDEGPHVYYRFGNSGDADATIAVRTVLTIDGGGTYEATAVADVPAGDEVTLEYPVVRYDALSDEEAENVRRGDADFDVYVNGEERSDA